jgi:hypothetical protein
VANAMRSQIDDVAKAALTFVCRQASSASTSATFPEADLNEADMREKARVQDLRDRDPVVRSSIGNAAEFSAL